MNNNIELSLVKTIKESNLKMLSIDMGELALDSILENDMIKRIPIFGTLYNLCKIGIDIRDYLFAKKLLQFLVALSDISCKERKNLIDKLESDVDFNQKTGEYIILLLDRMDDMQKPELMAKAFHLYLNSKINGNQLQRINFGIDRVFICNLTDLKQLLDGTTE